MKFLPVICIIIFSFFNTLFAANLPMEACDKAEISYKIENKITSMNLDICRNKFGQLYTKNCKDGCEFKELLQKMEIQEPDREFESPGAKLCKKIGFKNYIVQVKFQSTKIENIELCFNNKNTAIVSRAFLAGLSREISLKKVKSK